MKMRKRKGEVKNEKNKNYYHNSIYMFDVHSCLEVDGK